MAIELPRHVKKPGGLWRLVSTPDELAAAKKEGWVLRLGVAAADEPPTPPPLVDAPAVEASPAETPAPEPPPQADEPQRPKKRGRPRKLASA